MKKQPIPQEPIRKSEGFILILVLLILFFVHDHEEYPMKIDAFANHTFGHVESIERQNRILFKSVEALLENSNNNKLLEEICTSIVEDETSPVAIAKGYDCLAKISSQKTDKIAIFQAIKNESYALESAYNQQYLQNLFKYITQGFHVDISSNDELEVLKELSNSVNKDIKARALYRLSLINSLGRKSSLENYHYNLEEANSLRNQISQLIHFNKKKSIDVLFTLNNKQKYIQYAKTTIASILLNSDLDSEYHFYVISDYADSLSQINQEQLLSLQKIAPYTIQFMVTPKELFENQDGFKDLKTRLIFSRLLIEDLLPNLNSIISLDVDIVVLRDLYNLQHNSDIENYILMGTIEGQKTRDRTLCQFPYTYINAGTLVENLELMRKIKSSQLILANYQKTFAEKDSRCLTLPEQDLVNVLYNNQIGFLSKRWNNIPTLNFNTNYMPFIIHYAGWHAKVYNKLSEQLKLIHLSYMNFANNVAFTQ